MKIIEYQEKYRDDMIFMVLEAKNALGRVPHLNDDLLDIRGNYFLCGDMFWLAIDDNDRVIGCIGYNNKNPRLQGADFYLQSTFCVRVFFIFESCNGQAAQQTGVFVKQVDIDKRYCDIYNNMYMI